MFLRTYFFHFQVGFIGGICLPCYDLLVQVLPGTSPVRKQCEENLGSWIHLSKERKKGKKNVDQQKAATENQEEQDAPDEIGLKDEVNYYGLAFLFNNRLILSWHFNLNLLNYYNNNFFFCLPFRVLSSINGLHGYSSRKCRGVWNVPYISFISHKLCFHP